MSGGLVARRVAFYVLVITGAVVVHQGAFADLAGSSTTDFFRRNSEAYALMVLIPLHWDLFGWEMSPGDATGADRRTNWRNAGLVVWLAGLGVGVLLTQSTLPDRLGIDVAQSIVTLGEAFVAAAIISIYTASSRAVPSIAGGPGGGAVEPWSTRIWFYAAAATALVLSYQSVTATVLGEGTLEWLQVNVEAWTALLVIPLYFDVVAERFLPRWVRFVWYPLLVIVPALTQSGGFDGLLPVAVVDWLSRSTEAFIAAIVISLYFDVWRGPVGQERHASAGGEVPERSI